jgi:hypothetical protein
MSQRVTERHGTRQPPEPVESRHHDEHIEERETSRAVVDRRVWSPAQFVAGGIGLFLIVLGAVALLRSGFETLTAPTATVLGYEHTPLMAMISIVLGVMFLGAAASTLGVRGTLTFLGLLSLGFGLVMAIEPDRTSQWLAGGSSLGLLYAVIGGASLVAGWASPTIVRRRVATRTGHDKIESDSLS